MVIFAAAVLISMVVMLAEAFTPAWLHAAADYGEKGLFAVDLFCFALFILSETLKMIRGLWNEWRQP